MKALELRKKTAKELEKMLGKKRKELSELFLNKATGDSNHSKARNTKKEIARILTVLKTKS